MTNSSIRPFVDLATTEFPEIVKDSKNPHFKSTFASLTAIQSAIQPVLRNHGIIYYFQLENELLHLVLEHIATGVTERHTAPLFGENAQQYGASTTYQRRYLLQVAFNLAAVDDDGEAAMGRGEVPGAKSAEPPKSVAKKRW